MSSLACKLEQWSEVDGFEVVGDDDAAGEVAGGLGGVSLVPCGQMGVLGVVEQQVFHAQLLSRLPGIEGSGVIFLIGVELRAVAVEAERLAQQPVGLAGILLGHRVVGLVAQAGYALAVGQDGTEAELLGLDGANVEKSDLHVVDGESFAVGNLAQDNGVVERAANFPRHGEAADGAHGIGHFSVAVDGERCCVAALVNHG